MDSTTTSELQALLPYLSEQERALLDSYLGLSGDRWVPLAGPQQEAFLSLADVLFYGGAAGGGKTDLLLGLVERSHQRSIIFRREFPQLRGIIERYTDIRGGTDGFNQQTGVWRLGDRRLLELASVPRPKDAWRFQGRAHDLKGFDEICHFSEEQFRIITGWTRTADVTQRTRVVCTGNPPMQPEEEWVLRYFAPWLDKEHPNPAAPGELRWFVVIDGEDTEVGGPMIVHHKGEELQPKSRTFIPAHVEDNPFLMATGYKAQLQNLPEPLRTAMLKGVFGQQGEDNPWQLIPSAWVDAAMLRWQERPAPPMGLTALGVDVARGGKDKTVLVRRRGTWFDEVERHEGKATPDGPTVAALAIAALGSSGAPVNIDIIGVGGSAYDSLVIIPGLVVNPMVGSAKSEATDRSERLGFVNKRAEWYWKLREALDPDHGQELALPNDRELKADLCAPRWKLTTRGIQVEEKAAIAARLGRSPDSGDAVVYAFAEESSAMSILDALGAA